MEKHIFIQKIEIVKPLLWGRWRNVAERTGLHYSTVQNYIRGVAADEDKRVIIIDACEAEAKEIKRLIDEIYPGI